jgi:hypothetical protein
VKIVRRGGPDQNLSFMFDPDMRGQRFRSPRQSIDEARVDTAATQHALRRDTLMDANRPPGHAAGCAIDRHGDALRLTFA